jgi:FkbM family methyltransferase
MLSRLIRFYKRWIDQRRINSILRYRRYTPFETSLNGNRITVNDNISFLHSSKEIFVDEAYKFASKAETPFIIDCGANIGLSLLYFKNYYPSSRIIAFEPDPDLFQILEKNIANNNLESVTVIEAACWTDDGTIAFQKEGAHSGSATNFWDKSKQISVRAEKLAKYLEGQEIDLLKMDIEGAEFQVLMSLGPYLSNVKNIVFEYHSANNEDQKLSELLNLLKESGFRYHIKEAFTRRRPLYDSDVMLGMDLQLNVYGKR